MGLLLMVSTIVKYASAVSPLHPRCPCPQPLTCEYAVPYDKRDFADVILGWENYPGLSVWAQYNHKGPFTSEALMLEPEKT